jgi:S-adenosylmethionine-diacylgycerolhomoserine-N-methlytransferase
LTMVNPHWQQAVDLALSHLRLGGYLSVVDFHDTPLPFYRRFMKWHHVSLNGHLLPYLKAQTANPLYQIKPGLGRAWRYMIFRGQKGFS